MSFTDSLRALVEDGSVVWGFLASAAIVLVLTPLTARLAPRIGGVDLGGDRPRVHTRPVPRIGGLAIMLGILVPALVLVDLDGPYPGILIGTGAVALLGLVDDIRGLPPSVKLAAVCLIALIPVAGWDLKIDHFTLPFIGNHDIGWIAYPLTVVWIAFVAIAAAAFALLAMSFARADASALAAIVCGATLGFLWHNYHPAKIFMGDSGALALGFLLAAMAVEGVLKTAATVALAGPLLVMAVPILDTSFVVLKRLKYGRRPWAADHNHFYHRFMRIGFSQRRTAAYLHLWALLLVAYAILLRFVPPRPAGVWNTGHVLIAAGVGVVVLAASAWMVYTLEILKARHLKAMGLGRFLKDVDGVGPPETEEERQDTVERTVTAGLR
jgi:UDP-GlcNAc:undecaprenyl-phosphate GlcNAc-1-phosphate transferase